VRRTLFVALIIGWGLASAQPYYFYGSSSSIAGLYNWGSTWMPYQWYRYAEAYLRVDYTRALAHPTYLNILAVSSQNELTCTLDVYIDTAWNLNVPPDSWVYYDGGWMNWHAKDGGHYVGSLRTPTGTEGPVLARFSIEDWIRSHPSDFYFVTVDQNGDDWDAVVYQLWLGDTALLGVSEFAANPAPPNRVSASARPNPAAGPVLVTYSQNRPGSVSAFILDESGRTVRTLASRANQNSGGHSLRWDGLTDRGSRAPAGTYFYRIELPGQCTAGKVVLGD
jgi:hypothetical protein